MFGSSRLETILPLNTLDFQELLLDENELNDDGEGGSRPYLSHAYILQKRRIIYAAFQDGVLPGGSILKSFQEAVQTD